MNHPARTIFQDEIVKLQAFVLELAHKVQANGELMLEFLQEKNKMSEVFLKIKEKDKEIDKARWQVHDYGDELIVLQQPVANDFRQIIASIQTTDNLERIGDHFKKTARLFEKVSITDIEVPEEIVNMAKLGLKMLAQATDAYAKMLDGNPNQIASLDEEVNLLYKKTIKKIIELVKHAPEEKVDALTKLFFIAQSFERAADHAAKIGETVNYAITGKRGK